MRSLPLQTLLLTSVLALPGCSTISTTEILVARANLATGEATQELLAVLNEAAEEFGLKRFPHEEVDWISFEDQKPYGENPRIGMSAKRDAWPAEIFIREMHTEQPTERHKQLAESLRSKLQAKGFAVESLNASGASDGVSVILLVMGLLLAGVGVTVLVACFRLCRCCRRS